MRRVVHWTSGHPYLTQRLCEAVATTPSVSGKSSVDRIVSRIFLTDDAQISEPNLHDVGRRVSEGVPVGVDPNTYVRRTREIYAQLLRGRAVSDSSQDPVVASLKLSGLITANRGELRIRTRIYKHVFGWQWLASLGSKIAGADALDVARGPARVAANWFRGKPAKYTLVALGGIVLLIAGGYRYAWSFNQPRFEPRARTIRPGEKIVLRGDHLSGAEGTLSDDFGHVVSMPIKEDLNPQGIAKDFAYVLHVPQATPRGRYRLRIRRPPFLGFIPFGPGQNVVPIKIDDKRPMVLSGHNGIVTAAGFSPDGARIVTSGGDSMARVWDAKTGAMLFELRGHRNWVLCASFSNDGNLILTSSWDKTAMIWDASTGKPLTQLKGHDDRLVYAFFSPDARRVVTGSYDKTARIWDTKTGKELVKLKGHTDRVVGVAYSPDGSRVATASFDQTARIWDAKTGKELHKIQEGAFRYFFISFSPDSSRVITGSEDSTARVWDVKSGKEVQRLAHHLGWVVFAAYSPDGKRITTSSADKTAIIWDAATVQPILTLPEQKDRINTAYLSPDGSRLVTACFDKTARVWDSKTGKPASIPID
jgi:WD40 repeat protein